MNDLSQEKAIELFHYDAETGALQWRVQPDRNGKVSAKKAGTLGRHTGYVVVEIGRRKYQAHRLVWVMHHGPIQSGEIDHINRVKSDNRIENLRLATRSQQQGNSGVWRTNKSGYRGVTWNCASKKWAARVYANGRQIQVCLSPDRAVAFEAYCVAAKAKFGEFFDRESCIRKT
jgi:hypothetical protein